MKEPSSSQSHAAAWMVSIATALALYVLSVGPIEAWSFKHEIPEPVEKGMRILYQPLIWLHDHTFLKEPLQRYVRWWIEKTGGP